MNRHRDLPVWSDAGDLIRVVYAITRELPAEERFGVSAQLRRAAWSVQNNIAEGNARLGRRELRHFIDISIGSLAEVDSICGTLPDIHEVDPARLAQVEALRARINRGLFGLLRRPGR